MGNKYFKWIRDGYFKPGGVIYGPDKFDSRLLQDGKEIKGLENLSFTLKDGVYMPYHAANIGANLVNEDLKVLIQEFLPENYPLDFYPVEVHSHEYGGRIYYIMHFKIIFDILDRNNCIYNTFIPKEDSSIIIPCLDATKVNGLHIFNSRKHINDIIISDKLKKAIKKNKLDIGIEFNQMKCI